MHGLGHSLLAVSHQDGIGKVIRDCDNYVQAVLQEAADGEVRRLRPREEQT